ncbi:DUF2283 domain-containing protein [Streptomyces sp. NBC_00388]|uniref:DUF2283 domain-containing protein n=1 Tax=Streptomyces sp. NBC_00388 TaxID=2975735 RepID=UPI002E1B8659
MRHAGFNERSRQRIDVQAIRLPIQPEVGAVLEPVDKDSAASKTTAREPFTVADVRVTYDKTVDAAYVYLTEPQARVNSARMYPCDPVDVDAMINLDFDEHGRLIGVEVLAASSKLPEYLLQSAERLDTEGS